MTWGLILIQTVRLGVLGQSLAMFGICRPGVRLDVMTEEQREEWAEDEKNQTLALQSIDD